MTTPVFGYTPSRRDLRLSTGADFILNLVLQADAIWPIGTRIYIKLDTNNVWQAQIVGSVARWKVESEVTDLIPDGTPYQMYVSYDINDDEPTYEYMWFYGKVKRTRTS